MKGNLVRDELIYAGFNLFSVIDISSIDDPAVPDWCRSVLLIGSAGRQLWEKMPANFLDRSNPVDEYSAETVERVLNRHAQDDDWQLLFPTVAMSTNTAVPKLQSLGKVAGWHHHSPLGTGINGTHGLWFAYRAVVALAKSLPVTVVQAGISPCLSCVSTPCVSRCPAGAIQVGRSPDTISCATFRVQSESECAASCVARMSCPVAPQWQYSEQQMVYFYARSLPSLLRWVASRDNVVLDE